MRIAVIDKNRAFVREISAMIQAQKGWRLVGTADNGEQGIALIENEKPDVVLLELILPQKDGFSVLEYFSRNSVSSKFLAMSSLKDEHFIEKALNAGASYYLIKPFDMQLLRGRICDTLSLPDIPFDRTESDRELDKKLTDALLEIGVTSAFKGFECAKKCIIEVSKRPPSPAVNMTEIYCKVAPECDTDFELVERSIRHMIKVAIKNEKFENINRILGVRVFSRGENMTNKPFITLWAEMIRGGRLK